MQPIRVMIVEDSTTVRQFLEQLIGHDPRLEVVASAGSGEEALRLLERVKPQVISLDIRLPGINGFEVTRQVMSRCPTPIVVCSASVESEDLKISMNALAAGALSVVEKPVGLSHGDYETIAARLCSQLVVMSQVRVVTQRLTRRSANLDTPCDKPAHHEASHATLDAPLPDPLPRMIGIVASTGGPAALTQLLTAIPSDFPLPILLVQHITESFHQGFVDWLNDVSVLPVSTAKHGEQPQGGRVYVAPADRHLLLRGKRLMIQEGPPVSLQCPSGTLLLESMAKSLGNTAAGVILTGMGDDGADGICEIRRRGGYTIAEDQSTTVVYGMPRAAIERGGACQVLPLPMIVPRLVQMTPCKVGA